MNKPHKFYLWKSLLNILLFFSLAYIHVCLLRLLRCYLLSSIYLKIFLHMGTDNSLKHKYDSVAVWVKYWYYLITSCETLSIIFTALQILISICSPTLDFQKVPTLSHLLLSHQWHRTLILHDFSPILLFLIIIPFLKWQYCHPSETVHILKIPGQMPSPL